MKIAFVISSLQGGGAERVASLLLNYWVEREGWEVTLITVHPFDREGAYQLSKKVKVVPLNSGSSSRSIFEALASNLVRAYRLRQAILKQSPNVVISFGEITNCLVLFALLGTKFATIVSERVDPRFHLIPKSWSIIRRKLYPRAAAVVVQTKEVAQHFWEVSGLPTVVIENAVQPPPKGYQHKPENMVVAVGRLVSQKGFDILLNAFFKVYSKNKEWRLAIFGEGPERENLEARISQLGLGGAVQLSGREPYIFRAYARASIFVLSSRYEGFPNTLCEAMAAGLPVVSFNCPSGPRDIISNGQDGILVENGDSDALAAVLEELIKSPEMRMRLGAQAKINITRFAPDRIYEKWNRLICSVAGIGPH